MIFFRRLRAYLKALFANSDTDEDAIALLNQAQRQMAEVHARNRESAVGAIRLFHDLKEQVAHTEKHIAVLRARAEAARLRDDARLAEQLEKEAASYEPTLLLTRYALAQANECAEAVRHSIRRDDERIQQKTREALELQEEWRQSQQFPRPDAPPPGVDRNALERLALFLLAIFVLLIVLRLLWAA